MDTEEFDDLDEHAFHLMELPEDGESALFDLGALWDLNI